MGIRGEQIQDGSLNQADVDFIDDTSDNATTLKPGLLRKLSGVATQFLNGLGEWVALTAMSKPRIETNTFFPNEWTLVGSLYQASITITGVTTNHACYAMVDFGSEQNALNAKLSHQVACSANKVTFYAAALPTSNISIVMHIYDVGGATKGGVFLPMATPTDANIVLTDVTTNNASTTKHGFLPKLSGNAADVLHGDATFGAVTTQSPVDHSPNAATTETLNLASSLFHTVNLPVGAVTLALSNAAIGQRFIIQITQNAATGGTITWFSTIRWASGLVPTITATASKRDTFAFICTGTDTFDGFIVGQGA